MSPPKTSIRDGNGESSKGATNKKGKFPASKKKSKPSPSNSAGNNDNMSPSASSAKKLKISHYFGGAAMATPSPATAEANTKVIPGKGRVSGNDIEGKGVGGYDCWSSVRSKRDARTESRDRGSPIHAGTVKGLFAPATATSTAAPAPTWGKIVDPRKQRRWNLLRRVREGGHGSNWEDPTAWARRSYSLSYVPVFQDGRTPGMGSTSSGTWGWASQSQVFGGGRACLPPEPVLDGTKAESGLERGAIWEKRVRSDEGIAGESEEVFFVAEGYVEGSGSNSRTATGKSNNRNLQARNFRIMHTWLSRSFAGCVAREAYIVPQVGPATSSPPEAVPALSELEKTATGSRPSLLEVALTRRDGGPAAAFMTLASMDPELTVEVTQRNNPVALALRLYHGTSTWRRFSRRPALRRAGQGRGSRLHPNNATLAAAVDEADAHEREQRAEADYESALALLNAGLAVSLGSATSSDVTGVGGRIHNGGGRGAGQSLDSERQGDALAVLALADALTAAEIRALAKRLGISVSPSQTAASGRSGGTFTGRERGRSGTRGRERSTGGSLVGGVGGGWNDERNRSSDGKDEVCIAIEEWVSRPADAVKRRARVARMGQQANDLVMGSPNQGRARGSGGGGGDRGSGVWNAGGMSGTGVIVLRLADEVREAIHRVHVAFFAAARHGPHDVPALLREGLTRVSFGGADLAGGTHDHRKDRGNLPLGWNDSVTVRTWARSDSITRSDRLTAKRGNVRNSQPLGVLSDPWETAGDVGTGNDSLNTRAESGDNCPPPAILSSVEAFAEFYRLVVLADAMELAAGAGDSGLAYGSLHEASTALLPSGCPLCRSHPSSFVTRNVGLQRRKESEMQSLGATASISAADARRTLRSTAAAATEAVALAMPHCDICELSARVVMRGVALMERQKEYDNAFHYLEILLQASSQRLSVHRPRFWLRLVTDLGHKKRGMEALKACEAAIAEACSHCEQQPAASGTATAAAAATAVTNPGADRTKETPTPPEMMIMQTGTRRDLATKTADYPTSSNETIIDTEVPAATSVGRDREAAKQAAAVFPLCESLPLLRRAIRLAVPPLRWRKLPPPDLKEARVRVLRLDLSWRRRGNAGGGDGTGNGSAPIASQGGRRGSGANVILSASERLDTIKTVTALVENVGEEAEEEGGVAGSGAREGQQAGEGDEEVGGRSSTIASGTSLEDAVLDTILAELGPDWTGLHSENSICLGLFALLCWDALFAPAVPANPAADNSPVYRPFRSPFQSEPADLMTTAFAGRRRRILEGVYARVENEGAGTLIRRNWTRHVGKACTGLHWKLFPDGVDGWVTVASAIGPLPLSRICRNLASNYWAWRHGLPDLFVWRKDAAALTGTGGGSGDPGGGGVGCEGRSESNALSIHEKVVQITVGSSNHDEFPGYHDLSTNGNIGGTGDRSGHGDSEGLRGNADIEPTVRRERRCQWLEVKGPGDSLSCYQEAWIDTLVRAGAEAVVLRVEDTASS